MMDDDPPPKWQRTVTREFRVQVGTEPVKLDEAAGELVEERVVLQPWRLVALDRWNAIERLLKDTATFFLTPDASVRPEVWKTVSEQRVSALVKQTFLLLKEAGAKETATHKAAVLELYRLRNLLVHNASLREEQPSPEQLVVVKHLQFGAGDLEVLRYDEIAAVVEAADATASWIGGFVPIQVKGMSSPIPPEELERFRREEEERRERER